MLDMLKDKNLLIGAAIGVGASYAMKGSGKGTFPRAALYGVIGAAAGKISLPKVLGAPAAAAAPAAPAAPAITETPAPAPAAAEGMYVGRIRRHY